MPPPNFLCLFPGDLFVDPGNNLFDTLCDASAFLEIADTPFSNLFPDPHPLA
jgi:hypothetical protein